MSMITPPGGWNPVSQQQPQQPVSYYQPYPQPHPQPVIVHVAQRPRSVLTSLFKFLIGAFIVLVGIVTPPIGPVVLIVLLCLWLHRRKEAKAPVTYRVR